MPVKKGKMPKKSAKEMINPENKRITIFGIFPFLQAYKNLY